MRRRRRRIAPWLALPLFGGIGALLIVAAISIVVTTQRQRANYVATQGQVIGFDHRRNLRAPVVLYDAPGIEGIVITGTVYSSAPAYAVNDRIDVRYPPDNPANGVLDDPSEMFLLPGIMGFVGAIFAVVAFSSLRSGG